MTMKTARKLNSLGLLTALLAACAPVPAPAPVATATPTPAPSASAASATPVASATPTAAVALTGVIYDIDGAPVEAASVHVRSLDASIPFEATVGATAGRFVLDKVPPFVNLEVEASKPGWTTRKRVTSYGNAPVTVDFGAPGPDLAGPGAAFFLSDRPEITSTTPIYDGTPADPNVVRYAMAFSTPLDAANQALVTQALRILALDTDTTVGTIADPAASAEELGFPQDLNATDLGRFTVKAGTTFTRATRGAAGVTWNAEGTVATFGFDAPLLASRTLEARYLVVLAAGPQPIVDTRGRQLGTSTTGSFTAWPAVGKVVPNVFQAADLRTGPVTGLAPDSREARWANTHDAARRFRMPRDTQPPRITSVAASDQDLDELIAVTFDEPLAAYDGSKDGRLGAGTSSSTANVGGFSFAVGQRLNDLAGFVLNGKNPDVIDPRTVTTFGKEGDRRREVRFADAAIVTTRAAAPTGSVYMELDQDDPHRLLITIVGRRRFFDPTCTELAVRFQGPGDPAGNVILEGEANSHTYRGPL
jgi:hypothetical protein